MKIRNLAVTLISATLMALAQTKPQTPAAADPKAVKHSALNKGDLEAYLRHLFVWPQPIVVEIGDPSAGPMPGYYEVKVRGVSGAQMQNETFFVSFDGQKIIRGIVYDVAQNPFKAENEKIKTAGRPALGTQGAPVVIAEFSDFQCPYCKEEAKTIRENLLKTYPKEARLYFFDYPLEQIHPWAKPAAIAGRCVFKQSVDGFWAYHDWAFDHQSELSADSFQGKFLEFAKTLKDINSTDLQGCLVSKEAANEVNESTLIGQALNVSQTPTVFVNGRRLAGATNWNDLKFIIDYEIGYQKTAKNAGEDCGCDVSLPQFGGTSTTPPAGKLK